MWHLIKIMHTCSLDCTCLSTVIGTGHWIRIYSQLLGLYRSSTNEMVVYHEASRSMDRLCWFDHTCWSRSDRRSCREWLCRTISSKISLSLFSLSSDLSIVVPTVLVHEVTYKVWSVFNFRGWLHPWKLNTTIFCARNIFSTKYLRSTVYRQNLISYMYHPKLQISKCHLKNLCLVFLAKT